MIIKYLTELLLDHECVIVPEFGAFITKEIPAKLDYVNHVLTPPSKEIAFNRQLVADDGLLIGYVAERQGITRAEATKLVHDFAMKSLAVYEESGALPIDNSVNLLGDSFGLTTIKANPIYRRETYQHIATKIATEQKAKNTLMTVVGEEKEAKPHRVNRYNYKWFRAAAYSMIVALFLVFLGWGADKSDSRFASWNPLFYSSPNEFIVKHLDVMLDSREFEPVTTLPSLQVSIPICENEKEINYLQPIDSELLKPVDVNYYYIIGASFTTEKDAKRCVADFKKRGFEGAMALPMNAKGNVRVAYEMVFGKEAALKRLEIIKKEYNEAAWLLRKK